MALPAAFTNIPESCSFAPSDNINKIHNHSNSANSCPNPQWLPKARLKLIRNLRAFKNDALSAETQWLGSSLHASGVLLPCCAKSQGFDVPRGMAVPYLAKSQGFEGLSKMSIRCQRPKRTFVSASALLELVPEKKKEELDFELPRYSSMRNTPVDLVVVGAGPAGLAVAARVSTAGLSVCCIDPWPQSIWPNNYGVWVDEFEDLDLLDCVDYTWSSAVVYIDDNNKKYLQRPYGRVNRRRLKSKMIEQCISNGVHFLQAKVRNVSHGINRSFVACHDGTRIEAAIVLDATGFSRCLVEYDKPFNPGYQVAYGIVAEVDSHPFDLDKMVFMDWRDSHLQSNSNLLNNNKKLPTFLYAMPFSSKRIFLEETSLVARPGIPVDEIQKRMEARLKHLDITIKKIEEDEICVIPMGGVLPVIPQRVLGIGGTAGMVHPSTGYMIARTLAAAPTVANGIITRLGKYDTERSIKPSPIEAEHVSQNLQTEGPKLILAGKEFSAGVWSDLWPLERRKQREFFCFGMDVLLQLDLEGTRRFFSAFFDLEPYHWQGFLSSRLYILELGLALFMNAQTTAKVEMVVKGTPPLLQMLTNLAGMRK
ncbi:hypothetical protein O6H91_21G023300 [Diphasiastrum complanatum]|uniref:Uncharacterized protein n=2 Tax=Diphasiastrum complanatum TaxID=34168 RepID=A0ACC2AIN3_DIPCM|nr:hypothetical protein O6H91_21G007600 [Diphasiastrum complanatum]KAJ7517413.1 hypothetical protein O6H91_21G023300 [Diphasiastrum complanatum]